MSLPKNRRTVWRHKAAPAVRKHPGAWTPQKEVAMPRKTYPHPGHSATGSAFLPGKTPRLIVDTVEVAKILRRVLKRHFPGEKFYVRSERYSGGSSIDVVWSDGPPTLALVELLLEPDRGVDFDAMRDLKSYGDAVVVDDDGQSLETRPPLELQTRSAR